MEKWKSLKFNRNLQISNHGRLRTTSSGRIWKLSPNRNGYLAITLYHPSIKKSKGHLIHKLVVEYFIPKIEGKPQVNHKDFNKQNNHVSNLERCTAQENISHYFQNKFKGKVNNDDVLYIRKNIETIGARKLSKQFKINESYLMCIANGTYKSNVHKEFIRAKKPSIPVPVKKYDLMGNFVKEYTSQKSCAEDNGVKLSHIQRVLSGERKHLHGFVYKSKTYPQKTRNDKFFKEKLYQ